MSASTTIHSINQTSDISASSAGSSASLALSADLTERHAALQRAREHGLYVPRVAIVEAEHTIEHSLNNLPSSVKGPLPDLAKA